ncbi:IS3 family transposase [Bifidobacterium avesanii]|uniref:IS3 family transposase n=1 Tax=Bifidobacterium avesanii TaxID=1798157 RepID=UPI001EF8DC5F|nr:IS3 family transposase [Bifidobacterium avesanii]
MYRKDVKRMVVGLFYDDRINAPEIIRLLPGELDRPPSRATVHRWIREDPRYRPRGRQGASYTLGTKLDAVRALLACGDAAAAASRAGCAPGTVRAWARAYLEKGGAGLATGRGDAEAPDGGARELAELRERVEALRLENAVMRETIKVLKAGDPRPGPGRLTNGERTRVVDAIRGEFGLKASLDAVGLRRSTYYHQRGAIALGDKYAVLRRRVRRLFESGGRVWGYRTVHRMLRLDGADPLVVSEKVVRRIMREERLAPVYLKRARRWSSYAGEIGEAPANLVERDFRADAPNRLWVTDVTQFTVDGWKCWLSPVVDCFDGMVVSWTLSRSPNADMANRMLLDAVATLKDGERPVVHSDRGCHYRWPGWIRICEENGLTRSMSAKGCSPDNAAAEGFFGRLKNEFFYGRDWRGVGYDEFHARLAAYLSHYNGTRIKKSLGWMSPVQYRRHLGLAV